MIVSVFCKRMGLIAIVGCVAMAAAQGQVVVYSNLTSPPVPTSGNNIIGSGQTGGPTTFASQFTSTGNFNLLDAKVNVDKPPVPVGADPTFNVWLAADAGGLPGTFIEQIGFGLTAPPGNGGVITANSIATPIALTSGTTYWLVVTPATPQTVVEWLGLGSSMHASSLNHSPTFNSGWLGLPAQSYQFQIDAASPSVPPVPPGTPLPPSVILTLTGLASVGLYQMRRKVSVRRNPIG